MILFHENSENPQVFSDTIKFVLRVGIILQERLERWYRGKYLSRDYHFFQQGWNRFILILKWKRWKKLFIFLWIFCSSKALLKRSFAIKEIIRVNWFFLHFFYPKLSQPSKQTSLIYIFIIVKLFYTLCAITSSNFLQLIQLCWPNFYNLFNSADLIFTTYSTLLT